MAKAKEVVIGAMIGIKSATLADNGELTVVIDTKADNGDSASGKSTTIATTKGNKPVPGTENVILSINCYRPKPKSGK